MLTQTATRARASVARSTRFVSRAKSTSTASQAVKLKSFRTFPGREAARVLVAESNGDLDALASKIPTIPSVSAGHHQVEVTNGLADILLNHDWRFATVEKIARALEVDPSSPASSPLWRQAAHNASAWRPAGKLAPGSVAPRVMTAEDAQEAQRVFEQAVEVFAKSSRSNDEHILAALFPESFVRMLTTFAVLPNRAAMLDTVIAAGRASGKLPASVIAIAQAKSHDEAFATAVKHFEEDGTFAKRNQQLFSASFADSLVLPPQLAHSYLGKVIVAMQGTVQNEYYDATKRIFRNNLNNLGRVWSVAADKDAEHCKQMQGKVGAFIAEHNALLGEGSALATKAQVHMTSLLFLAGREADAKQLYEGTVKPLLDARYPKRPRKQTKQGGEAKAGPAEPTA